MIFFLYIAFKRELEESDFFLSEMYWKIINVKELAISNRAQIGLNYLKTCHEMYNIFGLRTMDGQKKTNSVETVLCHCS